MLAQQRRRMLSDLEMLAARWDGSVPLAQGAEPVRTPEDCARDLRAYIARLVKLDSPEDRH